MQMSQISFRIPPEDFELVKRWAEQKGTSIAKAFRQITGEAFDKWKLEYLVSQYCDGYIRLKEAWIKSNLPLMAFLKVLDDYDIDPPHTELMELKSEEKARILTHRTLFKNGEMIKRETPEIIIYGDHAP